MSVVDELVEANRAFARRFTRGGLPMPPKRKVAVVTCMDARILPAEILGLEFGDAHVIRNAGGRAQEALRSLVISEQLLGTREIAVIHHTDCGMLTFTDEELAAKLEDATGERPDWVPESFTDLDEDVRKAIGRIRESPFIPKTDDVRGFVYEVETGRLREVAAA